MNKNFINLPYENNKEFHTYHTFVIQVKKNRDKLKKFLLKNGVETSIHYPVPIHLQPAAKKFGYKRGDFKIAEAQSQKILTLPINESLSNLEIIKISNLINYFFLNKI